jgi:hypothetical protein
VADPILTAPEEPIPTTPITLVFDPGLSVSIANHGAARANVAVAVPTDSRTLIVTAQREELTSTCVVSVDRSPAKWRVELAGSRALCTKLN